LLIGGKYATDIERTLLRKGRKKYMYNIEKKCLGKPKCISENS
jgi:hypothetical protein